MCTRGFTKEEDKWTKWARAQSELEEICENQNLIQKLASKWEKEISTLMKKTTLFYNSYTGSLISNECTDKAPLLRKQSQTWDPLLIWDHYPFKAVQLARYLDDTVTVYTRQGNSYITSKNNDLEQSLGYPGSGSNSTCTLAMSSHTAGYHHRLLSLAAYVYVYMYNY